MSKARYFWITRDKPKKHYETWDQEPYWNEIKKRWDASCGCEWNSICSEAFEKTSGIHLKGGPRSITKRRLAK